MTLYQRVIARVERWIESIDRERDNLANATGYQLMSAIERAFVCERLAILEQERAEAVRTLAHLREREDRPELMFPARPPRMLKVQLRRVPDVRKRA